MRKIEIKINDKDYLDFLPICIDNELSGEDKLKNNQQVKIATCTIKGKIIGQWFSGNAKFLSEEENRKIIEMRDKKYGLMAKIAKFFSKSKGDLVAFSIKLD